MRISRNCYSSYVKTFSPVISWRGSLDSILQKLRLFQAYQLVLPLILHIFFKLPYVGPFSTVERKRLRKLLKHYCNNLDVELAFSSFRIHNMFSLKDPALVELLLNVVYKFTWARCNSCYVSETSRHLSTHLREHLHRDRTSHIFQQLQQSKACRSSCSAECFKVIDHATTKFQVKVKEALHISWEQPSLHKQLYHVN